MGEFKERDITREYNAWVREHHCKDCNKPMVQEPKAFVAVLSYRRKDYSILCERCYVRRMGKKQRDLPDPGPGNDYDLSTVIRACRQTEMRLRVEGSYLVALIDHTKNSKKTTPPGQMDGDTALALLSTNFPLTLRHIVTGNINVQNPQRSWKSFDLGYSREQRMMVFTQLARLLHPLLPKVSGLMLERIYAAQQPGIKDKVHHRSVRNNWRKQQAERPQRLFPMTAEATQFAGWVKRRLINAFTAVLPASVRYSSSDDGKNKALSELGVKNGDRVIHELRVAVYNTAKGPRFVVYFD